MSDRQLSPKIPPVRIGDTIFCRLKGIGGMGTPYANYNRFIIFVNGLDHDTYQRVGTNKVVKLTIQKVNLTYAFAEFGGIQ